MVFCNWILAQGGAEIIGGMTPNPAVLFALTMINRNITPDDVVALELETGLSREELLADGVLSVENPVFQLNYAVQIDTQTFREIANILGVSIEEMRANPPPWLTNIETSNWSAWFRRGGEHRHLYGTRDENPNVVATHSNRTSTHRKYYGYQLTADILPGMDIPSEIMDVLFGRFIKIPARFVTGSVDLSEDDFGILAAGLNLSEEQLRNDPPRLASKYQY